MAEKGVENYKYAIKYGAGETTPHRGQMGYYAVANGRNPGIQTYYFREHVTSIFERRNKRKPL
jgi:hypothetical protein